MNNHSAPHFDKLRAFDRLGAKKDDFTCLLCSVSECITLIFLRKRMFSVTLLKTKIHIINLNKSR